MKTRGIVLCGLLTALTAVGAQITINLGTVPFTLQVLFVLLSGLMLGPRYGFMSQVAYLLLGALGLPVFAGFSGGLVHIYGPSGGYLVAFPLAAFVAGWMSRKRESNFINLMTVSMLAVGVIYLLGWLRLGIYMQGNFVKAFMAGVTPFVVFDLMKAFVASLAALRLRRFIMMLAESEGE